MSTLRARAARLLRRAGNRVGLEVVPKRRYDVIPHDFYSPVPDLGALPDEVWGRRSELGGCDLRVDAALELIGSELGPYLGREFDFSLDGPAPPGRFYLRNGNYEAVDGELLFAMVRARRPGRIVELGSGFTTLLIGEACRRNAADGSPVDHVAYDPYPRAHILGDHAATRVEPLSATEVPLEAFRELGPGDFLFVDTTHTVKTGSDVNYMVLDVLPGLRSGVLVHFHDIFLPYEYPREFPAEHQYYWAEQYLLQAFLAFNDAFEVLLPAQAIAREHPERLRQSIPSFGPRVNPSSFWIVRR